ncbi:unnamed protein product [Victoria cruziana]
MERKQISCFLLFLLGTALCSHASYEGPWYDSSAYSECKKYPEPPLYDGGILKGADPKSYENQTGTVYSPAYVIHNLTKDTKYAFSAWVQVGGAESATVKARLAINDASIQCVGNVVAQGGCWSFLKGGFVPDSTASDAVLFFQNSGDANVDIQVSSASLQPFTDEEWTEHRQNWIAMRRKRRVTVHVTDLNGNRLQGAYVTLRQRSREFPFGSAISKTIIGNFQYQKWFVERFNAAVFENELKWYATEPDPGKLNYTLADQMLSFVRENQISVRGHNIFWEDPVYTPGWVRNLTGLDLVGAVSSRIESLMTRYKGEFMHWDVSNEMLHFDFYESRLGANASNRFFDTAQRADPWATLFMNEFNVVETCDDVNSTVDAYISMLRRVKGKSGMLEGIGLESHFTKPNIPFMRATLDKLATLGMPIWLTEVDISKTIDQQTQAIYLEEVLREGFSHPSVSGIMLWTALHPKGCYQMCLTDNDLRNLPPGDAVDRLLQEWFTGQVAGQTDGHGCFDFEGFLGDYDLSAAYGSKIVNSTLSLFQGDETLHFNLQI